MTSVQSAERSHSDWCRLLAARAMPCGVVDLDVFDRNAARVEAIVAGADVTVRLASKSVRVPALIQRVLERGGPWRGLMCYSAREMEWLAAELGLRDLLLAYPTVQASDLTALRRTHDAGAGVSIVVDEPEHLSVLSAVFADASAPLPVVVEVDASGSLLGVHVGVRRSPIRDVRSLLALIERIDATVGIRFGGVMVYEAQVAGLVDADPGQRAFSQVARVLRRRQAREVAKLRREIGAALRERGADDVVFNGGGTGSLEWAAAEADLTEVTMGSGLLCPRLFDLYTNLDFEPACWFALQAVRSSDDGYVTCQGGGFVASGEPGWSRVPYPASPAGAKLVSAEAAGEVQTPLRLPRGVNVAIGEPVIFRHAKAGELAEHLDTYLLVRGDEIVDEVPTYRGVAQRFP